MAVYTTLFLLLPIAILASKRNSDLTSFSLKDGDSKTISVQTDETHSVLYVRPPLDEEERKINKHREDGHRLLKETSPGVLDLAIAKTSKQLWDNQISQYYQTAFFPNTSGKLEVTLTCSIGPCRGIISAYGLKAEELNTDLKEFEIRKSAPVKLFSIKASSSYERIVGHFKMLTDAEHVVLEIFGAEAEIKGDEVSVSVAINCKKSDVKNIYAVLSGESKSSRYFQISAQLQTYNVFQSISFNDKLHDYLFSDQANTYKLRLSSTHSLIALSVMSNTIPRIMINPGEKPSDPRDAKSFEYDSVIEGDSFGSEFRVFLRPQGTDVLYLSVSGLPGPYSMSFQTMSELPEIYNNDRLIAFINKEDSSLQKYLVKAPIFDESNEMELKFKNLNQGSIVVSAVECQEDECEPVSSNTHSVAIDQDDENPNIVLRPSCSYPDNDGFCKFVIGVKESQSTQAYLIGAQMKQGTPRLKVNKEMKNYIVEGEVQQYVLDFNKEEGDFALKFTVSTNNVMYMISKDPKCQPVTKQCANYFGGADDIVILRGHQLKYSQFYIAIQARLTSLFIFTAQTQNEDKTQIKKLEEDETFKGVLSPGLSGEDIAYFRIEVDFDEVAKEIEQTDDTKNPVIEFNLHGPKYKLGLTVNVGTHLPSSQDFQLITLYNYLAIHPSDEHYIRKGNYTLAVEFLDHDYYEIVDNDTRIHFALTYSTSRTIKTLNIGQQYFDQLPAQAKKVYSFHHLLNNQSILVSKGDYNLQKVELSVSAYSTQSEDEQELILQLTKDSSTLRIESQDMYKLCSDEDGDDGEEIDLSQILDLSPVNCQMYITITNHGGTTSKFSLLVWSASEPIELLEGQKAVNNLENLISGVTYYYNLVSYAYDVQILLQSKHGNTNYTLMIKNRKDGSTLTEYKEAYKTQHAKSINSSAFEACRPNCMIILQVFGQLEESNSAVDRIVDYDDLVTIVISQQFVEIENGEPIQVTVDEPRHFIYPYIKTINPQSRLKIQLHELFGNGAMCLQFSDDNFIRMPFSKEKFCDYAVIGNTVELTLPQINEILEKNNLKDNPIMIIEVSNRHQGVGKYVLQIENDNQVENHKIHLGSPVRLTLDITDSAVYSFFNYQSETLHFKLIRLKGVGQISLKRCLDDAEKPCEVETLFDDQILGGQSSAQKLLAPDHKMYCSLCTYIFNVSTFGVALDAILIVTTDKNFVQLSQGITFTDYLNSKDDFNIYQFSFDTKAQIEVTIKEYYGQTSTKLSFEASLNYEDYQFGPHNANKYGQLLNQTKLDYYQILIPPRDHLIDKADEYDVIPYSNPNHTLAGYFLDDDIYIYITNLKDTPANYSITVTQNNIGTWLVLQDGVITTVALSQYQPTAVFQYNHAYQTEVKLIIKINAAYNNQYTQLIKVSIKNSLESNYTVLDTHPVAYKDQIFYDLKHSQGTIYILIENLLVDKDNSNTLDFAFDKSGDPLKHFGLPNFYKFGYNFNKRLDLSVSINSKDIYLLNSNTHIDSLQPNQQKFYESYVHEKGKFGIRLASCSGDLNISLEQNYSDFVQGTYSIVKGLNSGSTLDIVINVVAGPLYFKVSSSKEAATFKMSTQYYHPEQQVPYGLVYVGGNGKVSYNFPEADPDKIKISFSPLFCAGCDTTVQSNSKAYYKVSWGGSQRHASLLGLCGFNQFMDININVSELHSSLQVGQFPLDHQRAIEVELDVSKQSINQELYVTVVGVLETYNSNEVSGYEVYYSVAQITMPKNAYYMYKHHLTEFIIALTILSVFCIFMLCCLCYFYRKVRKVHKESLNLQLENRMHEVKSGIKGQGYGQLEEERQETQLDVPEQQSN